MTGRTMSCGFCIFYRQKPTLHIRCCSSSLSGSFNSLRWKPSWKADDARLNSGNDGSLPTLLITTAWIYFRSYGARPAGYTPGGDIIQVRNRLACQRNLVTYSLDSWWDFFTVRDPTRILRGILESSLKVEEPLPRSRTKT